jgi:hypothetical protein
LSLAAEAFVKLTAFLAAGGFVIGAAFQGFSGFEQALAEIDPGSMPLFGQSSVGDTLTYVVVMLLSAAAFAFLPRQFHVGVVENNRPDDIRTAQWLTPLYLLLINAFVLPTALGGKVLAASTTPADFYVLALPLSAGKAGLSLAVFLGGFSAAIGMVMIESMAMATMISNHLLLPAAERFTSLNPLRRYVLFMRWGAAACFIVGGYLFAELIGSAYPLVSIGLISFAAAFLLAPVALLGLYWRGANRAGALLGLGAGAAVWFYTLMLPTFVTAGWLPIRLLSEGPFGLSLLRPEALFGWAGLPSLAHGVIWSSAATLVGLLGGSALFRTSREEARLREAFLGDVRARLVQLDDRAPAVDGAQVLFRFREALGSYFARAETERLLQRALEQAGGSGHGWMTSARYAAFAVELERMLAGAFGAASARHMMKRLAPVELADTVQQPRGAALAELQQQPAAVPARWEEAVARERELALELDIRNAELAECKRQLRGILDNAAFGLLTIDQDMIAQSGYSLSCHELLETDDIAGRRLGELLPMGSALEEQYELCVRDACAGWPPDEAALDDAPQLFQTPSGRTLRLQPRLLPDDSGSTHVLVSISDISELTNARNVIRAVEKVPALELLGPIEQMVASFAERSGKQVAFAIHGADIRVDRSRLASLLQVVPHLLRNAIEHGVEPRDARQTKPEFASLVLEIIETDETYVLAVQDDGRGIDGARVLRAAVARGVVTEATARLMSESDVIKLVFRERPSTGARRHDVAERSAGLPAVHAEVRRLGGDIAILTKVGRGTRVEMTLPKRRGASQLETLPPRQTRSA